MVRALARGWHVCVVQFVKSGDWKVGEQIAQTAPSRAVRLGRPVVPAGHQRAALRMAAEGGRRSSRRSTVLQAEETGRAG